MDGRARLRRRIFPEGSGTPVVVVVCRLQEKLRRAEERLQWPVAQPYARGAVARRHTGFGPAAVPRLSGGGVAEFARRRDGATSPPGGGVSPRNIRRWLPRLDCNIDKKPSRLDREYLRMPPDIFSNNPLIWIAVNNRDPNIFI
jgi:hypothetical protein